MAFVHRASFGGLLFLLSGCSQLIGADEDRDLRQSPGVEQTWTAGEVLVPTTGDSTAALFGIDLAVSGDTTVISAPELTPSEGGYFVFARGAEAWAQETQLVLTQIQIHGGQSGRSLAISNGQILLGLPSNAHAFERTPTWTNTTSIKMAGVSSFGSACAVSGDTLAVGAPARDAAGQPRAGSVHVYGGSGAVYAERLPAIEAPNPTINGSFGYRVALDGDTLAVAAERNGAGEPTVFVFVRANDAWTLQQELTPPSADAGAFGDALSLQGDTLAVGAPLDAEGGPSAGAVFVYERQGTSWTHQKLVASQTESGARLGESVSIDGDALLVGAPFADSRGSNSGKAYLFRRTDSSWRETDVVVTDVAVKDAQFGRAVGLVGFEGLVGAPTAGGGSVQVVRFDPAGP